MDAVLMGLGKASHVTVGDFRPNHFPPQHIGPLPHRMALGLVVQHFQDAPGNGRGVAKRNEQSPAVRQQFFGIPVGGRNHGLAGADCVSQRPRSDLGRVEIRGDVNVGRPNEFDQLF